MNNNAVIFHINHKHKKRRRQQQQQTQEQQQEQPQAQLISIQHIWSWQSCPHLVKKTRSLCGPCPAAVLAKFQRQDVEELGIGGADAVEIRLHLRQRLAFKDFAFLAREPSKRPVLNQQK